MRHLTFSNHSDCSFDRKVAGSGSRGQSHPNCDGFTIFEVALASFVMAIGLSTAIIAMQMGFKSLNDARDTTLAAQIMQSEIERIRLMAWSQVSNTTVLPASATVDLSTMFTANTQIASKFTLTRTVSDDQTRPTEIKKISLSVTWKSYDGRSHTRSFDTIYSKNGLYDYYYTVAAP